MGKQFFNTLIIILLSSLYSIANLRAQDCNPPAYSNVFNITDSTAIIIWSDYSNNNSWNLVISPTEIEDPSTVLVTATVTGTTTSGSYMAQGLIPETDYHYYIQAHCSENSNSSWLAGTFRTRCAAHTIPYEIDFNAYESSESSFPDCWTKIQGTSFITYANSSHGNALILQRSCDVALPKFNLPVNTLRIHFSIMTTTAMALEVGVTEGLDNLSTYTMIETINTTSTNTFFERTINLGSYNGSGRYIFLRNVSNSNNNYTYIDDLSVSIIPDCISPVNVQASNIQATSATLTWEESGDATQWQTLLSTTPITNFSTQTPSSASTTSLLANGLSPNTTYHFYVRAVCSSDFSEWTELTFSTPCNSTALPTSEVFSSNQIPSCWNRERVVGNADVTFVGYGNNPYCNPIASTAMVQWASSTNGTGWQSRLVSLPLNTVGVDAVDVNFKWNHDLSNSNGLNDGVQIQYSTDGITWTNSAHGMIPRYDGEHNGWTEYDIILPEAGNQSSVYIGFLFNTGGGGSNCYMDDVHFLPASGCFTPVGVAVNDISGNSATITWTELGSATSWYIFLSRTPVTDFSTITPIHVTSPTYTATNLEPAVTYYVYVRAKCSASSFSEWTTATTFTSGCGTILSLPFTESFEDYGTCSDAFPPCWIRHGQPDLGTYFHNGQTCFTPSATDINAFDGDKSLMVCTPSGCITYTITTPIQENIRNLAVTFYLLKSAENYTGNFEVGVMSNPNDPATFESIATINLPTANEWTFVPVSFANANLSGSGNRIAFRHYGMVDNNYYLVDALNIIEAPDCWPAFFLSADDITGNSTTLNWMDANEPAAQWRVKVSDAPITDFSQTANVFDQTISSSTVTIDYLLGGTTYHYYVQSLCSDNATGQWEHGTFTTLPCNCYVDIYMNDQWANGWEGGKIQMKHGTTVFAEATMPNGAHDTARIYTCEAQNIDYYFVSGSYDSDISFTIVNSLGTTLYASSGTPVAGCFYSAVPACGVSCGTAPANLSVTATAEGNSLTWDAAPEDVTYSVYRENTMIANYVTTTSYTDANPASATDCYTVTAHCIVGESSHSNEACLPSDTNSITDIANSPAVSIFPNPAKDRFTVSADFPIQSISVVNLLGQEVIRKDMTGNRTEINVSELPDGIYLVKILDGKNWIVRKIIVE